jgi:hypothetical protein
MLATTDRKDISPLNRNRKRTRNHQEEISTKEMDLDFEPKSNTKSIASLNLEQLQICQKIAIEQLKNTLFLTLEFEAESQSKNPFTTGMDDDSPHNKVKLY